MTHNEAITYMGYYRQKLIDSVSDGLDKDIEAYDLAIEALEETGSVKEKIQLYGLNGWIRKIDDDQVLAKLFRYQDDFNILDIIYDLTGPMLHYGLKLIKVGEFVELATIGRRIYGSVECTLKRVNE